MVEAETTLPAPAARRPGFSRFYTDYLGRRVFALLVALHGVGAFALITLGVLLRKLGVARAVVLAVTTPRGTHLGTIEVQPEAPSKGASDG